MRPSNFPDEIFSNSAGVRRGHIAKQIAMKLLPKCKDVGSSVIEWEGMRIGVRSRTVVENKALFDVRSATSLDIDSFILVLFSLKDDKIYTFFTPLHTASRLYLSDRGSRWSEFKVTSTKDIRKVINNLREAL